MCNEQEGWDCTDECKMSPGKGHPEKAGANQQCQERTVGKLVMTAETTLLGCKSPWKKERGEDVGLGQKCLSLDVWGLVCGTRGGLAELDPARQGLGTRAGKGLSGTA